MLILLKTACFGIWLLMMILLILADQAKSSQAMLFSLHLADPSRAEMQIYDSLRHLSSDRQLNLQISASNPFCSEIYFIAACIYRKNPSIIIQALSLSGD